MGYPPKTQETNKKKLNRILILDLEMHGGYIILVEKPNKQGKSNPWYIFNTTPSLNCCTLTHPLYVGIVVLSTRVGIRTHI